MTKIVSPPSIQGRNPMPLDWEDKVPRMRDLYVRAREQEYNPLVAVPWKDLHANDFSPEERVAVAYWIACDGTFENSGVPTFARAMIGSYEDHEGDDVSRMLLTVTRDEMNHDEMCRKISQTLVPGFPFEFEPKTKLEQAAQDNLRWVSYINSRYWSGYMRAYAERRFSAIITAFIMGEAAASLIFLQTGERAKHPVLKEAFHLIAHDESRHFAFCNYMAEKSFGTFTEREKELMTKNLRASFVYISLILDVPRMPFWDVPPGFVDAHMDLEARAVAAGLGLPPIEDRRELWRKAALRVKAVTDRHGIVFPALPEVGIEGVETPLTAEDFAVVTF